MYKKILVAIDGSACGDRALDEAIGIAQACQAELEILHVIEGGYEQEVREGLVRAGRKLLAEAQARAEARSVVCHVVLSDEQEVPGDVASLVSQALASSHAQLLVLGTHGRRGLRRLLMGSVAEGMVRHSLVPVLLVRVPEED